MARACGSYPQCHWFNSSCRYQSLASKALITSSALSGPLVKRLRLRPFTPATRVRVPYGSPIQSFLKLCIFLCDIMFLDKNRQDNYVNFLFKSRFVHSIVTLPCKYMVICMSVYIFLTFFVVQCGKIPKLTIHANSNKT